jgi:hypothetical protein
MAELIPTPYSPEQLPPVPSPENLGIEPQSPGLPVVPSPIESVVDAAALQQSIHEIQNGAVLSSGVVGVENQAMINEVERDAAIGEISLARTVVRKVEPEDFAARWHGAA